MALGKASHSIVVGVAGTARPVEGSKADAPQTAAHKMNVAIHRCAVCRDERLGKRNDFIIDWISGTPVWLFGFGQSPRKHELCRSSIRRPRRRRSDGSRNEP